MCFSYTLNTSTKSLKERFNLQKENRQFDPVYHVNAFAFPKMPIITNEEQRNLNFFQWGLIPNWVKNDTKADKIKKFTLNARSETIFEKPSFKIPIIQKRCLIPATGFFEWHHINKEKIPYFIFSAKQNIFSFAGIWETYTNENNEEVNTYSIITCKANPFMANIHNTKKRMPVILNLKQESLWLDNNLMKNEINKIFREVEIDLDAYTINKSIGNAKFNSNTPEIFQKFNYKESNLGL